LERSDSGKDLVGRIGYTEVVVVVVVVVVDIYFKNDEYEKSEGKRGISNEFLSEECTKAIVGIQQTQEEIRSREWCSSLRH